MLGSWQLDKFCTSEQFSAFADAYLDSAERLCKVLARSTKKASYPRCAVVLFLTFHSIELFLKSAILKKSPNEPLNHNVSTYRVRYKNLYPGKIFNIKIPFETEYIGFEPPEIEKLKKSIPPTDQLYRYPSDKNGKQWKALLAFEPISFLKVIANLKADYSRINKQINNG